MNPCIVGGVSRVILERRRRESNVAYARLLDIDEALEAWVHFGDFTEFSMSSENHTIGANHGRSEVQNWVVAPWTDTTFSP